ncbi:MAG: LD-carboxypeptidase, partial [Gammaproteobacteria bacterium]|nr:LD-carboxypeptidase [Gammaproteobacteria bacterium]
RLLTQLWLAKKLSEVAGIAFGKFTKTETDGNTFSIEEVLRDRCSNLGIPVVRGFMIGHVADRTVVPIGIEAELNADDTTLTLLDTAVV